MSLMEAIEARAVELFGFRGDRTSSAVCYVCWVMQLAPSDPKDNYFMLRVKNCNSARQSDPAFDKKVADLVTYAIHFKERS